MVATTLQALFCCKPSHSLSSSKRFHLPRCSSSLSFNPLSLSTFTSPTFQRSRFCPRTISVVVPCTLRPESASFDSERLDFSDASSVSDSKDSNSVDFDGESASFNGNSSVSESGHSEVDAIEMKSEFGEVGSEVKSEKVEESEGKGGSLNESEERKSGNLIKSKIPLVVLLMGMWVKVINYFEKMMKWDWLSWWPFWKQEKRLEKLIAEADANPKDPAKQSALLAELNKHR